MNSSLTGHQPAQQAIGGELWNSLGSFLDDPGAAGTPQAAPPQGPVPVQPLQVLPEVPGIFTPTRARSTGRNSWLSASFLFIYPSIFVLLRSKQGSAPFDSGDLFSFHVPGISSFFSPSALFQSRECTEAHLILGFDPGEEFRV